MEYVIFVLVIVLLAVVHQAWRGRSWQRQHTYMEEFWHSNGW
jgi:hypothetical protein